MKKCIIFGFLIIILSGCAGIRKSICSKEMVCCEVVGEVYKELDRIIEKYKLK